MKLLIPIGLAFCILPAACSRSPAQFPRVPSIPSCNKQQLLGYTPSLQDAEAHRRFKPQPITYPFGTKLDFLRGWGLLLTLRVDESGKVTCFDSKDEIGKQLTLNDQRRAAIQGMASWRYEPFVRNGIPVVAIVSEKINEQEMPERHVPLPHAPLESIQIALQRGECFGSCPGYQVTVDGAGHATYHGYDYVDVPGAHSYGVPPGEVAALAQSLNSKDLWSLRAAYRSMITDSPTYTLTIKVGEESHVIEDYVGEAAGMPAVVTEFEGEVDKVARADMWVHLSMATVEQLKSENFDFRSRDAATILARAIANEETLDNDAILTLIRLGTPITGARPARGMSYRGPTQSILDDALQNRRTTLIDDLVARGALITSGRFDQAKIDSAFRAAIAGGSLDAVKRMWSVAGERSHPSLTFVSRSEDKKGASKLAPVTLVLEHHTYQSTPWDGLEIAKWLVSQGCNLKASAADGDTLLHIAAEAGDVSFVKYLLDQGIPASTPGRFGLPALGSAQNEDVALALLQAGTDLSMMNDAGNSFQKYAQENHWQRVMAWLDTPNIR